MKTANVRGWILVLALVVPAAAIAQRGPPAPAQGPLEQVIRDTASPDRLVRIAAIKGLRSHAGPEAVETLARILSDEPADAEVREENWAVAADTLARVAVVAPLPASVLARLETLAETKPVVLELRQGDRIAHEVPKFDFPTEADIALREAGFSTERRDLEWEVGRRSSKGVAWLADVAWSGTESKRRRAAQAVLRKHGAQGLESTLAAVQGAPESAQLEMPSYVKDVCAAQADAGCHEILSALLDSRYANVPPQAWLALGDLALPGASDLAIQKLRTRGLTGDRFTEAGLNALGRFKDAKSLAFVAAELANEDRGVAFKAASELTQFGELGVQALIASSRSTNAPRRRAAIVGLASVELLSKDPRAREAIDEALAAHPEDRGSEDLRGLEP
jgi:hypothetical protein